MQLFNPPLRRNGVEVTSIDEDANTISIVVYLKGVSPLQVLTPEFNDIIQAKADDTINYLQVEGYVEKSRGWRRSTGVILTT